MIEKFKKQDWRTSALKVENKMSMPVSNKIVLTQTSLIIAQKIYKEWRNKITESQKIKPEINVSYVITKKYNLRTQMKLLYFLKDQNKLYFTTLI